MLGAVNLAHVREHVSGLVDASSHPFIDELLSQLSWTRISHGSYLLRSGSQILPEGVASYLHTIVWK